MEISEKLKRFLEDRSNRELLNSYNFKELYRELLTQGTTPGIVGEFTSLMYEIDVDPLLYLDEVPNKFLLYGENIKKVEIPTNIISIGGYAFYCCRSLTDVTIPNSVTSIAYAAFHGCSGLTSITIPDSVTSIGYRAFGWCSGLNNVIIGNGVKSIGEKVFRGCNKLIDITYRGTINQWNTIRKNEQWKTDSSIKTIHCTDGDIKLYGW